MKILLINLEFDCAGVSWNLRNALVAAGHEALHVMTRATYAAPKTDRMFRDPHEILDLCEWADVLHFNQWIWTHRVGHRVLEFVPENEYGNGHPFAKVMQHKRVVYHFHGGQHQLRPDYWISECRRVGAKILKCDPLCPLDGAAWLPNVLDVENIEPVHANLPLRVAIMGSLSDTRRNNAAVCAALKYLGISHDCFGTDPRAKALQERRSYPVHVDNFTQGFVGMWTWEGLAQGATVYARLAPAVEAAYERVWDIIPPICNVQNIDEFAASLLRYKHLPGAGREWTLTYNNPVQAAKRYLEFYA